MFIDRQVELKKFSHYKIGGPADFFVFIKKEEDLAEVKSWLDREKIFFFVLGGGTNILFSDEGFRGVILKPEFKKIEVIRKNDDFVEVEAGAGVEVRDFLENSVVSGWQGLEWAGGLPGMMGGAVRGNAGAFGGEIKDNIESVKSFDLLRGEFKRRSLAECGFGYRDSVFKRGASKEVIVSVNLRLNFDDKEKIKTEIDEHIKYRKERQPLEYPNIGSIFKNVPVERFKEEVRRKVESVIKRDPFPVVPTAYLLSEAGLKGETRGGAMISEKHPNFIINHDSAKADDVKYLIRLAKERVKNEFGVELEEEVEIR